MLISGLARRTGIHLFRRSAADRPSSPGARNAEAAFCGYVFLRDNPAGVHRELWFHEQGGRSWLIVKRNTVTHEILGVEQVGENGPSACSGGYCVRNLFDWRVALFGSGNGEMHARGNWDRGKLARTAMRRRRRLHNCAHLLCAKQKARLGPAAEKGAVPQPLLPFIGPILFKPTTRVSLSHRARR
ncbi:MULTISPECIES: sarcosine oxidase subunit delta [Mesorhizobium]|uniref:sarcosine oxidase subunit delta n=1 Tax=Mesorhizobium TaxID=68287 RepID=UPI00197F2276|nr:MULTISPECIES: sarcosine oxidase subunit delta [Mesorhizobium]